MSKINDILAGLGDLAEKYTNVPPIELDTYSFVRNIVPEIPKIEIDEESTFAYQMQQQTNQIIAKSNEQIELLNQHNQQLASNYKKLEDLYALKAQELEDAKQDAKKAKKIQHNYANHCPCFGRYCSCLPCGDYSNRFALKV